MKQAC